MPLYVQIGLLNGIRNLMQDTMAVRAGDNEWVRSGAHMQHTQT